MSFEGLVEDVVHAGHRRRHVCQLDAGGVALLEHGQLLEALPDAKPVADALAEYVDNKTNSLKLDDAQADYARASEVLSCAVEAAYESGDADHIAAVMALMDQRHANQQPVTGQFVAAGRT